MIDRQYKSQSSTVSFPIEAREARYTISLGGEEVVGRVLECESGRELGDIQNICRDLEHVILCCAHLLNSQTSQFEKMTYEDSALIRYRRCFGTGKRLRIRDSDIEELGDGFLDSHRHIYALADRNVAHPVNNLENAFSLVFVPADPNLESKHGIVSYRALSGGEGVIRPLMQIAEALLVLIKQRQPLIEIAFDEAVGLLSRSEKLSLPEMVMPVNLDGGMIKKPRI